MFYAVKANPAPEVLALLASLGSCFDTASVAEIEMALAAGATADRISFGNTIKKERDIARAYALGVRLFAVDCKAEVEKIARAAPGAQGVLPHSSSTAPAPNGRCRASSAASRRWRSTCSSTPIGSGSSPMASRSMSARSSAAPQAWDEALAVGGGDLPRLRRARHQRSPWSISAAASRPSTCKDVPAVKTYGRSIFRALRKHFGNRIPETIIEPGRGMVGNAGVIEAEVVLVSKKSERRRRALGLSRHRQVRRPRRDDGRVDPLPDPHAARRRRGRRPACSPARPAIRRTCCTRRSPTRCRSASRSATRC